MGKRIIGFIYKNRGSSGLYLKYLLIVVLLQSVFRLCFVLLYSYRLEDTPFGDLLLAFVMGLRFDMASGATILMPFFLLSLVGVLNRFSWYRRLWASAPLLVIVWLIAHEAADIIYFENANKHIGYEGFAFLGDLALLLKSAVYQNPYVVIAAFLSLLVAVVLMVWAYRRFIHDYDFPRDVSYRIAVPRVLIFLIIGVILMRGGLQDRILRPSTALIGQNDFVNNIALNPVFTMLVDVRSYSVPADKRMDMEEALWLVRREIDYPGAEFISEEYPLMRKTIVRRKPAIPPNVVIILMENWTGKFVQPIGDGLVDGKEVTPFFNRFYKNGLFFDHFMASGGRTVNGLLSMLTGMPDKPGLTVFRSHHILSAFRPLPQILKESGYDTYFVTGGPLEFTNKKQILPHWGFDTVLGMEYMSGLNRYQRDEQGWGFFDEDIYDVFHEVLSERQAGQKPFLAVFESLSTHYPYHTPDERFRIFDESTRDYEFLNSYYYSDWALGKYMQRALQSNYADNTVFIIVGDHTHHRYLNYYEDRNIPLLIYWPGHIQPGIDTDISSQLDLVPTILGMLGVETHFAALGKDLLDPEARRSAYFAHGNIFGWIEDTTFYYQLTDAKFGMGRVTEESLYTIPTCTQEGGRCDRYRRKGIAFLNVGVRLIDEQRVFPKDEETLQAVLERSNTEVLPGCALSLQDHYNALEKRAMQFEGLIENFHSGRAVPELRAFLPPDSRDAASLVDFQKRLRVQEDLIQQQLDKTLSDARVALSGQARFDPSIERNQQLQNIRIIPAERRALVDTQMFTLILNTGDLAAVRERERLLREAARLNRMDLPKETLAELENAPEITPVQQQVSIKQTGWTLAGDCHWYPSIEIPDAASMN